MASVRPRIGDAAPGWFPPKHPETARGTTSGVSLRSARVRANRRRAGIAKRRRAPSPPPGAVLAVLEPRWLRRGAPNRAGLDSTSGGGPPSGRRYGGRVRIGVLTGGGDCPGLNAAIRAIVRKGNDRYGHAIVGFRDGWRGPLENAHGELTIESTRGILPRGGTILGTSRTNPFKDPNGPDRIRETMQSLHLDGLIAIGGEDTLGAAARPNEGHGCPVLGVPKTIDNDLGATDMTFGFDTAVQVATEAIDRLHTTAESHNRVMVVEVMGRHAGWIALHSGLAGGADVILIPERPFDIDDVCRLIRRRHARGRYGGDRRRDRRVRARPPRRDRPAAGARDHRAHRLRDAHHRAGPHPARRYADGVRPCARDAPRHRGGRRRE